MRFDLFFCSNKNLVNHWRPMSKRIIAPNSDFDSKSMVFALRNSVSVKRFINSLMGSSPARQSRLIDEAHEGTEFWDSERIKLRQSVDSILGLTCTSGSSRRLVKVLLFEFLRLEGGFIKSFKRNKSRCISSSLRLAPGIARARSYPPEFRDSKESDRVVLLTWDFSPALFGKDLEEVDVDDEDELDEEEERDFSFCFFERKASNRGPKEIVTNVSAATYSPSDSKTYAMAFFVM
ncbi:hypothetical protein GQX74_001086 [Glossina fuscipes]|nr:hypothetical protein GQX74_001086 [Glossina fuscipes]